MSLLKVSDIHFRDERNFELKNISFTQQPLQKIAIAGETGSGKSTLLKIIAGLVQPDAGEVLFEGERIKGPYEQLIAGHPKIAYLSQYFELRNNYYVEEILEYANRIYESDTLYRVCDITHLLKRKTNELSGGEKQRVALARLLSTAPSLLLLDEPFSNLDLIHKNILKNVINEIGTALSITCILVSHDPQDTLPWADEILIMRNGSVVETGSPSMIYHRPGDAYVAGLFGKYNILGDAIAASLGSPVIPTSGKKLMVRPEDIIVSTQSNNPVNGLVTHTFFTGSTIELEIIIGKEKLLCRTTDSDIRPGDKVSLALKKEKIWQI